MEERHESVWHVGSEWIGAGSGALAGGGGGGEYGECGTTRTPQGGAYRRQLLVFRARPMPRFPLLLAHLRKSTPDGGVRVERVTGDTAPLPLRFEPGHPDADAAGYVTYPNVNPAMEMADLLSAVRAYQLNAAAVQSAKNMIQQTLQILS